MEEDLNIRKKAELTLGGNILLPKGFVLPHRVSRSTAGPGAGLESAVFSFAGHRVKKTVSYESGEFELHDNDGKLSITRNGQPFLDGIEIKPVVFHCPEQAFFNLDQRCIFNCAFCTSPRLDKSTVKDLTNEKMVDLIRTAMIEQDVVAISLTSGVIGNVDDTVERFVSCVLALRKEFPNIPIGVEPYVSNEDHITALKNAGATEIKLNIESSSREVFERVCPDLDFDHILELLQTAVRVFGKGMVTSNIIFGMGETDKEMEEMTDILCSQGIIPTFRALRTNSMNKDTLMKAIGEPPTITSERAIYLANMLKEKLTAHGLDTRNCHTMCIECTCCDLIPFRDL